MIKKDIWFKRHPVWITIMSICLLIISLSIIFSGGDSEQNEPQLNEFGEYYEVDNAAACVMAQLMIEGQLKAPSTAEFQWCHDADILYFGNQTYKVYSYVDAQNSFGAMIRTKYWVRLIDQGETWHMEDFLIY